MHQHVAFNCMNCYLTTCWRQLSTGWLKPVFIDPRWLTFYLANSGLSLGSKLQAATINSVVRDAGRDAIKVERQTDGRVGLIVPEPKSFFIVPNDALHVE